MLKREIRRRAKKIIWPTMAICMVGYFSYHVLHGKHGIEAWRTLKQDIVQAEQILQQKTENRGKLEKRVELLRSAHLCPDMLDEQVRQVLGYSGDEIVIVHESWQDPK